MLITLSVIQQLAQTPCYDASNAWYLEHTLSNTHPCLYTYILRDPSSCHSRASTMEHYFLTPISSHCIFLHIRFGIVNLKGKQHLMIAPAISLLCAFIPISTKQNLISWWLCQAVNNMGTPQHQDYYFLREPGQFEWHNSHVVVLVQLSEGRGKLKSCGNARAVPSRQWHWCHIANPWQ